MSLRYFNWYIEFADEEQRATSWINGDNKGHVELQLISIFNQINHKHGETDGSIDTIKIFLLLD